jgi:hypothetical protein
MEYIGKIPKKGRKPDVMKLLFTLTFLVRSKKLDFKN